MRVRMGRCLHQLAPENVTQAVQHVSDRRQVGYKKDNDTQSFHGEPQENIPMLLCSRGGLPYAAVHAEVQQG